MQTIEEAIEDIKAHLIDLCAFPKWIDIEEELPEYYQPILADNGEYIAVVARVSDGDEDFYPICGTHVYMNPDPIKWRSIELK